MTEKLKKDGTPAKAAGRKVGAKGTRSLKDRKFKDLGLLIKPSVVKALEKAVSLLEDEKSSAQVQLSAAKFIIDKYGECIKEAYGNDPKKNNNSVEDDEEEDEKPQAAILSFVVPPKK